MKDTYFTQILSLLSVGVVCSGFSISGYLHGTETAAIGGLQLQYPAPVRKVPLALAGAGFCIAAWSLTQDRKEYRRQYRLWEQHQHQHLAYQRQIASQADAQAYQQVAALQAAERYYPAMQPYLDAEYQELPQTPQQPALPQQAQYPQQAPASPNQSPQQPNEAGSLSEQSGLLPIRDLTAEIAQYDGHILIASRTRSGKTTSIQSAIRHTHGRYNGAVEFHIFDPKGASWCGLESNQRQYLFCNEPHHIPTVLERLESLIKLMQGRQNRRMQLGGHYSSGNEPNPVIVAIDEFNTLQSLAQEYDESFPTKDNPRTQKKIQRYVERFIFQGAEDKVYLWLMAQTTRVEQLGLNTSVQDNMAYFAQSRNGDYQSVEDAVSNTYVVSNPAQRKELNNLLTSYRYDSSQDLKIPLAFTTLGGNQLCKLPDLSQSKFYQVPSVQSSVQPPVQPIQDSIQIQPELNQFKPDSDPVNWLNRLYKASPSHPELSELNQFNTPESSPESGLSDDELRSRIAELRGQGMNKNQIIFVIWNAKPGGSKAYKQAVQEYDRLIGGSS